ncbi:MAG: glycosyltransferase [Pseudomonadota bacterium]|nr:glycosyltransferase [Pseudomonadota bacterium]
MPPLSAKDLPAVYSSVLKGQQKVVVWGNTRSLTFHEWQRQTPAAFVADTQWRWWHHKCVHGIAICSPDEIRKLPVGKTIVTNNYYYSPASERIETYLERIGGYRTVKPAPLYEMVRIASQDGMRSPTRLSEKHLVQYVNKSLGDMLTAPANLETRKPLPKVAELTSFFTSYDNASYLQKALGGLREENAASYRARSGHVALFIGALHPGGAERQICNLAVGLQRAGWSATVLVYNTGKAETAHYRRFLIDNGVNYHVICPPEDEDNVADSLAAFEGVPADIMHVLWHLRAETLAYTLHTYKALRKLRPELLISYLDWQNVFSGLGATLAGTPRLLMSGRNAAPTYFPHFYGAMTDSFREIYHLALSQPGARLSNNSAWGGKIYERWLGLSPKSIPTVLNCVTEEFLRPVEPALIRRKRRELSLRKGQPFVLGVFRLAPEKRPLDFVRVIAALHKRHPQIRALICGEGPLEEEMLAKIHKLKLVDVITLAGVVEDIPLLMRTATLLLHTSEAEGSPNVVLEAQAVGLPVVCTDSGGIRACLAEGWSPFMKKCGDIGGLVAASHHLITNPALAKKLGIESGRYIRRRFSVAALTRNTLSAAGITVKGR